MVSAKTVKGLADRLAKAEALVADGAVFPVAGCVGYAVVRNGGGDSMYLVRFDTGRENCTCPDFKNRQGTAGLPCKHLLAAQIVAAGDKPQPPAPAASIKPVDPISIETARKLGIMAPTKVAA